MEVEELLITTSTTPRLAFSPIEAARTYHKINRAASAARQGDQSKQTKAEGTYHIETRETSEGYYFCADCGEDIDIAVSVIELREITNANVQNLCYNCADNLADELEEYAAENADRLADAL